MRKADALMAQPKPLLTMIRSTIMGKMTPPSELPAAMIPSAKARFLKNQVVVDDMAG